MRPRLYISHSADRDVLSALEYGRVDDGQPGENWEELDGGFRFLHDRPGGQVVGFTVGPYSEFDPQAFGSPEIWQSPRFDAPLVGLTDAPAGEVIVATRALLGDRPTLNRIYFELALNEEGEDALDHWISCLESGDSMAHFALGYTLLEMGHHHEAYRHLRHYAQIAPAHPWVHCWLGKGAEAIGELAEARSAYERAVELTAAGAEETDAPELLASLGER